MVELEQLTNPIPAERHVQCRFNLKANGVIPTRANDVCEVNIGGSVSSYESSNFSPVREDKVRNKQPHGYMSILR